MMSCSFQHSRSMSYRINRRGLYPQGECNRSVKSSSSNWNPRRSRMPPTCRRRVPLLSVTINDSCEDSRLGRT